MFADAMMAVQEVGPARLATVSSYRCLPMVLTLLLRIFTSVISIVSILKGFRRFEKKINSLLFKRFFFNASYLVERVCSTELLSFMWVCSWPPVGRDQGDSSLCFQLVTTDELSMDFLFGQYEPPYNRIYNDL